MALFSVSEAGKRLLLNLATLLAMILAALFLLSSVFQPPPQTQLDLFQTNLALQATRTLDQPEYQALSQLLLGSDAIPAATHRYEQASQRLQNRLTLLQEPMMRSGEGTPFPSAEILNYQTELDALRIRTGLLQAYTDHLKEAQTNWLEVQTETFQPCAAVLMGLWGTPIRILPDAETDIRATLDGWFEATALQRLLTLQQRVDALNAWNQEQEQLAISALVRLSIVGGVPVVGSGLGILLLLGWVGWKLWRKQPFLGRAWVIPWQGRSIQMVLSTWFLAFWSLGQLVPSVYHTLLGIAAQQLNFWQQAIQLLLTYCAGATVGLLLIYTLIRRYYPLSREVLRIRLWDPWILWGIGGYLAAMPLVILAGAVAQLLWPDGGGGNPILSLILDSQGWGPRLIFLGVVSICAPVFEEILFRGILMSTLTRYVSVGWSIVLSGVLFAVAHLSMAELLPLTVLGIVMGVVYSHSRNLLSNILLHSLWNAGAFFSLVVLSGN